MLLGACREIPVGRQILVRVGAAVGSRRIFQDVILPVRPGLVVVRGAILTPIHLVTVLEIHGQLQDFFAGVLAIFAAIEGPIELVCLVAVWVERLGVGTLQFATMRFSFCFLNEQKGGEAVEAGSHP